MEKVKLEPQRVEDVAKRVIEEIKAAYVDIKGMRGFFGALAVAQRVVEKVEAIGQELGLLGTDKKEIAVNAVLALVPDRWLPDWVLEPFVSWAIEKAVAALKEKFKR